MQHRVSTRLPLVALFAILALSALSSCAQAQQRPLETYRYKEIEYNNQALNAYPFLKDAINCLAWARSQAMPICWNISMAWVR
jgi:hypothetical protein